jgi:hypothetical protein
VTNNAGRGAAVAAARRGWAVFPLRPGDKRPVVDRWEQRAVADPARVAKHWPSDQHNVGIACGPSGLVVVDLDTPKGRLDLPDEWANVEGIREGADIFTVLVERAGATWPDTYTVMSPTSGTHLYFQAPDGVEVRNSQGKVAPMVDIRASGGYIVAAGSITTVGRYEVLNDTRPVPLPAWLRETLTRRPEQRPQPEAPEHRGAPVPRLRGLVDTVLHAPPHQGNGVLFWASCRGAEMVAAGELDEPTVSGVLLRAAVERGRPEREARATIASGMGRAR